MPSVTVRMSESVREKLRLMSSNSGRPMQEILETAVEEYERKMFWGQFNKAYGDMRRNLKAWKQELEERAVWDAAIADGLEDK